MVQASGSVAGLTSSRGLRALPSGKPSRRPVPGRDSESPVLPSKPISAMNELDRQSLGEVPPVAPGQSPFHIKATGYLGHMKWIEESYPGGRDGFLNALTPPMREFFSQQFFAMSFIDLMPLVCAGHTCARAFRMP